MPGPEPSAPQRAGASVTSTAARRGASASAARRFASNSGHRGRPGAPRVGAAPTSSTGVAAPAVRSGQSSPAPAEATPACTSCCACLAASQDVLRAYAALLLNAKQLFLDDAVRHFRGDEAWVRVLHSLGWSDQRFSGEGGGATPAHADK
ncbi:hypothetical protein NESM_000613300 [Novymonas esmeraldas]|uniref:Uncharacterized protein n=1 Tax=Novymonas esmeraldas TaxID=1808958 RepID=A0AAW0ERC4_9TRYP